MSRTSWTRTRQWLTALGALLATAGAPCLAATAPDDPDDVRTIAGRDVAVWMPAGAGSSRHPLVLFSHGVGGCKTQSTYLMRALAEAGMLVVAPDHRGDEGSFCPARRPTPEDMPKEFRDFVTGASKGGSAFYSVRGQDVRDLRDALLNDRDLSPLVDPDRVVLVGHSLGGYTVLGLAGAWPTGWKMNKVAAVVALAPFVAPFGKDGRPAGIDVPVLFQVGTADGQAPPATLDALGIYAGMPSPACKVTYQGADHFAWTDLDQGAGFRDETAADTVAFLKAVFDGNKPTAAILTPLPMAKPECR